MRRTRPRRAILLATAAAFPAFSACSLDSTMHDRSDPTLSVAIHDASQREPFRYESDIAVRLQLDTSSAQGLNSSVHGKMLQQSGVDVAPVARGMYMAYHLTYSDTAGVIIVDMTEPASVTDKSGQTEMMTVPNWKRLKRIRFSSEREHPEILLTDGRVVSADPAEPFGPVHGLATRPSTIPTTLKAVSPSRALREKRLRAMLSSLVRTTPMNGSANPSADTRNESDDQEHEAEWARMSGRVEALKRRTMQPSAGPNASRSVVLTVEHVKITGAPTFLP